MTNAELIHKITAAVSKRFPEFQITEDMKGLPTVIFGFLTGHLIRSFRTGNASVVRSFIDLVNELFRSDDLIARSCLDELVIGLHGEAIDVYTGFQRQVPAEVSVYFSTIIHMWTSGKNRST